MSDTAAARDAWIGRVLGVKAAATPDPAVRTKLDTARRAWLATRKQVESDIRKLQQSFGEAFTDHALAADLQAAFQDRVEKVLTALDESLAHTLDAAQQEADPQRHAKLVGDARRIIQQYETYVAGEPTLAELDTNPFVPLAIRPTLTKTLAALSRAIR